MADFSVDKILKLPAQHKAAIVAALLVALCAAYYFLVFKSMVETLDSRSEELTKLRSKHNEQKKIIANLPRFKQELKDLQLKFEKSLKLLPNTREIPSLLTNISNLAQESGLQIDLFQPSPELTKSFYAEIPVSMKVSGKYHDLGYFFDKVSKLSRIVNIKDIQLLSARRGRGNDPSTLTASFDAVTFKFIQKSSPSKKKKRKRRR